MATWFEISRDDLVHNYDCTEDYEDWFYQLEDEEERFEIRWVSYAENGDIITDSHANEYRVVSDMYEVRELNGDTIGYVVKRKVPRTR